MIDIMFTKGRLLKSISSQPVGEYGEHLWYTTDWVADGRELQPRHVTRIKITMKTGEMAHVPWALVTHRDGSESLVNLALMEEVVLAKG